MVNYCILSCMILEIATQLILDYDLHIHARLDWRIVSTDTNEL